MSTAQLSHYRLKFSFLNC